MDKAILKGRLDGKQRNRLKGLFDMLYSPRELAEEIGINKDQFYMVYIPLGCPHKRDLSRSILINGKEFEKWYIQSYPKIRLSSSETFCKTCKKPVEIYKPKNRKKNNLYYILSTCPNCQRTLTKITGNTKGE